MSDDRTVIIGPATPWGHVFRSAGHIAGFLSCGAALLTLPAVTSGWLEIAAAIFVLGIVSALLGWISMRSFSFYSDEAHGHLSSPLAEQLAVERLIIASLLAFSSVVAFFCGRAVAILALFRS
jgi:hypothetical protein